MVRDKIAFLLALGVWCFITTNKSESHLKLPCKKLPTIAVYRAQVCRIIRKYSFPSILKILVVKNFNVMAYVLIQNSSYFVTEKSRVEIIFLLSRFYSILIILIQK